MRFYHLYLPWLAVLLIFGGTLTAQGDRNVFYEQTGEGKVLVCAWKSIPLHDAPGRGARQIGTVVFAEELDHLGEEALVKDERRNYLFLRNGEGREGWVDEYYLVPDGGVVVSLKDLKVYERPGTYTSVTADFFQEGEIAILTDFQDNWVKLTSYQKELVGWVEGYRNISVDPADIQAATSLGKALAINDPSLRRQEVAKIGASRSNLSPEMSAIIQKTAVALGSTASVNPQTGRPEVLYDQNYYTPNGEDVYSKTPPNQGTGTMNNTPALGARRAGISEKEVVDMATGRTYRQLLETGTVQPVANKKAADKYYCYHKSLPIGSTVLLEIPGGQGYVPLKVIAPLRSDNPNVIGLGGELIKTIYGVVQAKDIGLVTIAYPKP